MLNVLSPQLRGYGGAGLGVVLALLLKRLIEVQIAVDNPFLLFFPVVMGSIWYGGLGPGLLATIVTSLLSYYFFIDPNYSLFFTYFGQIFGSEPTVGQSLHWMPKPEQTLQLGLYILQALLFCGLMGVLHLRRLQGETFKNQEKTRSLFHPTASQQEQLANILENITDALWTLDREWRFTSINRRGEELLHKDRAELLGKMIWDVYPDAIASTSYNKYHEAVNTGVPVQFEQRCPNHQIWLQEHVYPYQEGIFVYVQDITQRKRGEEALRYLDKTSQFLANSLDYESTLAQVAQLPVPVMADWCFVEIFREDGSLRRLPVVHADPSKTELAIKLAQYSPDPKGSHAIARVLRTGQAEIISELSDSLLEATTHDAEHLRIIREIGLKSAAIVPLIARGQILGCITLVTAESGRCYDTADLALVEDLARRGALAVDNARLYRDTEQALQRRAELLSLIDALFAAAPVAMCFLDKELRYIRINQVLAAINGLSVEEHLGRRYRDLLPEMAAQFEPQLQQVLDTGVPLLNVEISGEAPGEAGRYGYWLGNYYPVSDADGQTVGIGIILTDITETKQVQEALRQSEEHLRLVVQQMPVMMDAFDADWNIIVWNRECERITGYSAEEIIGNPRARELLYPDAAYRTRMFAEHRAQDESYRDWEWDITCKDGSLKTIAWSNISKQFTIPGWVTWGIGIDTTDRKRAEEALKTSQERLLLAQKVGKIGSFEWNLQTKQLTWTQELEALYGLAPGSFGGNYKDWLKALHPDDRTQAKQEVRCILTQGLDFNMEYRILWPDGSIHWIASRAQVFNDDTGKPWRMIGVHKDITERKQAEEALRESEERFRVMFNQAAVGIALVGLDGYFIQVNPAMSEITGYSTDELLQMRIQDISHPEEQQVDFEGFQRVVAREINGYSVEKRYFHKNGSIIWVNVTVSAVWDSNGQPKYGVGIIEDISERQAALRERKRAEASQQFLVKASTMLAASLDYETTLNNVAHLAVPSLADWCLVDVFHADASIRQIAIACADPSKQATLEELRRRYPPDPKQPNSAWQRLLKGESILYPELTDVQMVASAQNDQHLQLLRSLGKRSVMIVPIQSRQQVLGVISFAASESGRCYNPADLALAEDIARRAATAIDNARLYRDSEAARNAAQEANRMKDEFLAILSHELRSPLNAILGWTQMLRTRKFSEEATARALETIERNARVQTQLIEDLLDVSRIIRGKLSLNIRPLNLASVIDAAINTVRPAADAKGIQLEFIPTAKAGLISGDANRLQQVVWNLLSNSIKFTPQGGRVEIRVDSQTKDLSGRLYTQIQVTDTGKGISPEFLPHVFDRFRQADSTTTRSYGGLGLGLAIVRHLVELHGGTVQAESPGQEQGATFTVKLPLLEKSRDVSHSRKKSPSHLLTNTPVTSKRLPADAPNVVSTPLSLSASQPLADLRVLVVDDEADTRDYLIAALKESGAQVTGVASVSQALSEIGQLLPDILVTDIGMPGEDGYSLIQQVRALAPEQGGLIAAVAVTAYASEEDAKRAIAAGFQVHLPKPVESPQLVAVLARLAGRSEETDAT